MTIASRPARATMMASGQQAIEGGSSMGTIAQQEFSRQLFDLTHWGFDDPLRPWTKDWFADEDDEEARRNIPLYDADYLQAKLREVLIDPAPLDDPWRLDIAVFKMGAYATLTREATGTKYARGGGDAAEALLRLCILLAKKGVVTKKETDDGKA